MRQSTISTAEICLKRAKYSLSSTERHASEASAAGTGYHAGLEWFYPNCDRHGPPRLNELEKMLVVAESALYAELSSCRVRLSSDDDLASRMITGLREYVGHGKMEPQFWGPQYKVLGVEYKIIGRYGDVDVTGSVDLALEEDDGGVILVDHKTAGRKWDKHKHDPRKNVQSPWYWYWFQQMNPDVPRVRFCFDIMTISGKGSACTFERRLSEVMPKHAEAVLEKAIAYNTLLQYPVELLPGNTSSTLCSEVYCDFWDVCPNGAVAE